MIKLMTNKPIATPPTMPPAIAPMGDLLSPDVLCGVFRGIAGCNTSGICVGDEVCIEGTFVVLMGEISTGVNVCIEGAGTGNTSIGEIVGLLTGGGEGTGTDAGVVGTVLIVKHPLSAYWSQCSSVTIATSDISRESADDELAGNVADVLHMYRIPSFPYMSNGLSKWYSSSAHSMYKSL